MNLEFKPLFRSNTQVLIPNTLTEGVLQAIDMLGGKRLLVMADHNIKDVPSFVALRENIDKSGAEVVFHWVAAKEPDVVWVDEHVAEVKDILPDIVLGVGGGSLIDLAKAVSVLIYNEGPAAQYQGPNLVKQAGAKKIMVPTTTGTGSEVTPGAVVVNREIGRKGAIGSPYIMPDVAILDPSLTVNMPGVVTAATGMDAITHCMESYVGKAHNPFAMMYAREGFKLLINVFSKVLAHPDDLDSRRDMLIGSCMAGYAIFNTDTGACHSMAYPLGTYHDVPHGIANALLIPRVMAHNIDHGCYRYADLYDLVHDRDPTVSGKERKSRALLVYLRDLIAKTELPEGLSGYGITEDNIPDLAAKGLELKTALNNNPVPFEIQDAVNLLEALASRD